MGAETTYYVKVGKMAYEWVEVSAITSAEAYEEALRLPGVAIAVAVTRDLSECEVENK